MSTTVSPVSPRFRSKTVSAALAFLFGSLGFHRFYLYGLRDILLLVASERTSVLGWILVVPGAVSLLSAFLTAIVYGLRTDQKWDAQFNAHTGKHSRSGWTVIFVVIFSLLIGAFLLMTGLAVSFQTYFESQVEAAKSLSQ
jgi:vacuolar-type H+-ATPase subunit I/STV1